jgi:predicted nucleotidyltransferase
MKRDEAITIIRQNRATLESVGVAHAYLFGSVARDEAGSDSDVDVMIDVIHEPFSMLKVIHVKNALKDMLNRDVDVIVRIDALVEGKKLNDAAKEAVSVF